MPAERIKHMSKMKHLSFEDIDRIINGGIINDGIINGVQGTDNYEEQLLQLLQHLNACQECLDNVKAHRRLEILLENWQPELHGEAYRKKVYLEHLKEKKKEAAGMAKPGSGAAHEYGHGHVHDEHGHCSGDSHAHNHELDCECGCNDEVDEDDVEYYVVDEEGREHPHLHTSKRYNRKAGHSEEHDHDHDNGHEYDD